MKVIFSLIFLMSIVSNNTFAINIDSLAKEATIHAAHKNISELRPIYQQLGDNMPHFVRLYCDIAIASTEGRHDRVIECIDSLEHWYPKKLSNKTLLSLAELKAESLRQNGQYKELEEHCIKEIKKFKNKRFKDSLLKELVHYKKKASRLLGKDTRSQILQLADRNLIFELDSLLQTPNCKTDEFAHLCSTITLSHAFRKYDSLLKSSEALTIKYADSLDAEALTRCIKTHADVLVMKGEWKLLKEWTDKTANIDRAHTANIDYYRYLAEKLHNKERTQLYIPSNNCSIQTTYEWPLLIRASVNNHEETEFCIETEQANTFICEDLAKTCQAEILPDTISLVSSNGIVEVCPTLVDKLKIGDIIYKNLLVYTILSTNKIPQPFSCVLGTNEIARLGKITFYPEKMIVSNLRKNTDLTNSKNLYLSQKNGLRINAFNKNKKQPLSFDIGYANNVLNNVCFTSQEEDERAPIAIKAGTAEMEIYKSVFVDEKIVGYSGILGLPFLHGHDKVVIDFNQMRLEVGQPLDYLVSRGIFGHHTDKFYLQRNAKALTAGGYIEDDENDFLQLLLAIGKNVPHKVVEISKRLRQQESEFYDAYTEAEALFLNQEYKESVDLLNQVLTHKFPFLQLSPSEEKALSAVLKHYRLFKGIGPIEITGAKNSGKLTKDKYGWIKIQSNGKNKYANIDIFSEKTTISEKYLKKFKAHILGTANGTTYAIIPALEIGGIKIANVPCIVDKDKNHTKTFLPKDGKGIRIGWDLIRHFKQVVFTANELEFSMEKGQTTKKKSPLYYLKDFVVETTGLNSYTTFSISHSDNGAFIPETLTLAGIKCLKSDFKKIPDSNTIKTCGNISLDYLIEKAGTITFDLETMDIY